MSPAHRYPWPTRRNALDIICFIGHRLGVDREGELDPAFDPEFDAVPAEVQDEVLARAKLLKALGSALGRPRVDTLNVSRHTNMKELRFATAGGIWRVAFAFAPQRRAIPLIAGNKSGFGERRFYRQPINRADERFEPHLNRLRDERGTT